MIRSELIQKIADENPHLTQRHVERIVNTVFEEIIEAGAGFALALYRRGHLGDAIVAHITSNALVAVAVLGAGRWELWG